MTVFVQSSRQLIIELASVLPGHSYNLPMTIIQDSEVAALRYRPTDYGHLTTSEVVPVSQLIALAGDNQAQQQKSMRCPVDQIVHSDGRCDGRRCIAEFGHYIVLQSVVPRMVKDK